MGMAAKRVDRYQRIGLDGSVWSKLAVAPAAQATRAIRHVPFRSILWRAETVETLVS